MTPCDIVVRVGTHEAVEAAHRGSEQELRLTPEGQVEATLPYANTMDP